MMPEGNSSNKRRERMIRYAPLIFWTGVIMYLSSGEGSMSNTSLFLRPLLHFLFPNATDAELVGYHGYVRKFAHFAEYFLFGFLSARALAGSSRLTLRKYFYVIAFALTAALASGDEFNQSFEPTRTSSVWDVLLDIFGGTSGIVSFAAVSYYFRSRPGSSPQGRTKQHRE